MVVFFISENGSSKKVALHIANTLNIECFDLKINKNINDYKDIFLVFWLDKGNIPSEVPLIKNKNLALVFTCGADAQGEYIKKKAKEFYEYFNNLNNVYDILAINGAISDTYINQARELAKINKNYIITKEQEERWQKSKSRPNENDLKLSKNYAIKIKEKIMKLQNAKDHMNNDHKDSLYRLVKHHTGVDAKEVELVDITYTGMDIVYDGKTLHLDYKTKADENSLHYSVIELVSETKQDTSKLNAEIKEFKLGFKSVNIASLAANNTVVCSYAPIVFKDDEMFIFISEVADHFAAIKSNPNNVEIMFLEDESKAKSVFARRRLKYFVNAEIVDSRRDELFAILSQSFGAEVNVFAKMMDFHFIKLNIKGGRFVKGFGAAFDIDENNQAAEVRVSMPHKMHK